MFLSEPTSAAPAGILPQRSAPRPAIHYPRGGPALMKRNMRNRLDYLLNRLRERLWVKPLIACLLSVSGVLLAHLADNIAVDWKVPEIAQGSIMDLLKIIAASMLGVATFAVASMVAAYASTGQSATARAFPLVVADDVSQNALSVFVGAFIYAIVALSATSNDYFGKAGRFTLFVLTLLAMVAVILVFVRWVDSIARLGRLGAVIAKVEQATAQAMQRRRRDPWLGGVALRAAPAGRPLHGASIGFLQRVDVALLQRIATRHRLRIALAVLPGAMVSPARPLAYVLRDGEDERTDDDIPARAEIEKAFTVGPLRHFDDDPRFGLVVLAEIGSRALSPATNDPGTAIAVLGALHRLFALWTCPHEAAEPECDRVSAPLLALGDLLEDGFNPIARDGAQVMEVAMRLQRVLGEIGACGDAGTRAEARRHAGLALARAERALDFAPDLEQVRRRYAAYWRTAEESSFDTANHDRKRLASGH